MGKTTALGELPGKTLIIDIDRGTDVLAGKKNIEIVRLSPDLKDLTPTIEELEKKCDYDNVCIDTLSELERGMLGILGRLGRNGGAPELAHYNQVQYRIIDIVRRLRLISANIVLTAWEEYKDVVSLDGTKFSQTRPMMSGKTAENICGLCNLVGELIISPKDGARYVRLQASPTLVAKDLIFKREFCTPDHLLIAEEKETKANA